MIDWGLYITVSMLFAFVVGIVAIAILGNRRKLLGVYIVLGGTIVIALISWVNRPPQQNFHGTVAIPEGLGSSGVRVALSNAYLKCDDDVVSQLRKTMKVSLKNDEIHLDIQTRNDGVQRLAAVYLHQLDKELRAAIWRHRGSALKSKKADVDGSE